MYILISDTPRPGQTWLEKTENSASLKSALPLAIFALVTDLYILLLPISGVMRLRLSHQKRLALVMVFMTGIGSVLPFLTAAMFNGPCLLANTMAVHVSVLRSVYITESF